MNKEGIYGVITEQGTETAHWLKHLLIVRQKRVLPKIHQSGYGYPKEREICSYRV